MVFYSQDNQFLAAGLFGPRFLNIMNFVLSHRSSTNFFLLIIFLLVLKSAANLLHPKQKVECQFDCGQATTIQHLAIVMDGNRRWAKERGLPTSLGHREGASSVEHTIKFCLSRGIKMLSLYAFSLENFQRSEEEKRAIFDLMHETLEHWPKKDNTEGVQIKFIGDRKLFPTKILPAIERIEAATAKNNGLLVNIMFCYGGQQEIVSAAQAVAEKVLAGALKPDEVNANTLSACSWTGNIPPPDLIIRTGNKTRLSNFMNLQSSYSEIHFSKLYWPEFKTADLDKACRNFEASLRSFGR